MITGKGKTWMFTAMMNAGNLNWRTDWCWHMESVRMWIDLIKIGVYDFPASEPDRVLVPG